jgi:V/A-type H+-transporting ATPase subunit E
MEEIRGTEALEREILEDARKRADRIIRKAEENARLLGAQTEQRIKEATAALLSEYQIKKRTAELEMLSRLPLEKARLDILYRDEMLRKALKEALASMNPRLFGLWCVKRLVCQVELVRKSPAKVLVHGLDSETMRDIGALFGQGSDISIEEAPTMKVRGLIVEPMDASYRISITENDLLEWLLDEKRGELAAALFGSSD